MKTLLLSFIFSLLAVGCSHDDKNKTYQLPPETKIGANTFGVTIKGKVYIPRDPTGINYGPSGHGAIYAGSSTLPWSEIIVIDGASAVGFKIVIHFKELLNNAVGIYTLKKSNYHTGLDSDPVDHIFFKIWDSAISNYAYYGSIEDQGEINVTRIDGTPTTDYILSGTFKGKFVRYDNPNDFIEITDGRFDFNLNNLGNQAYP